MTQLRVLVTGANGFVGKAVCNLAVREGFSVRAALRKYVDHSGQIETVIVGNVDDVTDWGSALDQVDVVIHLAARVHVMHDTSLDPLIEFRKVNVQGTHNLAMQAVRAGVKRLVFVSSIKVNGEESDIDSIYSEDDAPKPLDPYGISKLEAEQVLRGVSKETGLEVVIVRPPLVYGVGVKGNFVQMLRLLSKGVPLPFASVSNQRSLVYVENLADAIITCAIHPAAASQTYLISDGEDISTPELLGQLALGMGRHLKLFYCHPKILELAGRGFGRSNQVRRLLGSLRIDSDKIRRELNWTPPFTLQQGLQATAEWYRKEHL